MTVIDKYLKISKDRSLRGIYSGDVCEYCKSTGSRQESKYQADTDVCGKCGAAMPKISEAKLFGVPVLLSDYVEVSNAMSEYCHFSTSTATIMYKKNNA